ncbi:uncharacterized protein LOC129301536 [Prosopis cineraria]|uniref:uncharacterized protein LOC129301536 n=1 Tax=Prosopis cineraria TaxID=364024 RepID=UPI00240FAA33|nr:uncharacterized protein LOC129301536 [Prosopis cineraria]
MTMGNPVFVEWEEQIICQERGNRVTHFYLRDASGNSVLAVVGTERSIRHMMYVVSDEFLQAYGSRDIISGCKWRARREVVDWLTCLVSRNRHQHMDDLDALMNDSAQAVNSLEALTTGTSANKTYSSYKMVSRKLKIQSSDIEWSGTSWFCAKQLKHYSGFCRNGTTIYVHSFVYIMAEEEIQYLGYIEDMYEDKKGQKKVKVRWFHHGQEVKQVMPQLNLQPGEVFITSHVQVVSADCVNGPAIVLSPKHYEKCLLAASQASSADVHVCSRQFKNNKLKPFSLSKLRGYCNQSVLSCLSSPILSKRKVKHPKLHREDEEDPSRPSSKRNRSSKGYQILGKVSSTLQNAARKNQITECEPVFPMLKLKLSRKTMGIKVIGPKPKSHPSFKDDDRIEILCQDSGIRGCWFRCKMLHTSQKKLKVQYEDILDVDGKGKLEEWIPAYRVASPDKLGIRCTGRFTVRPHPPEDTADRTFEIGIPVDAWLGDGWWEGVITAVNVCGVDTLQVYSPGEGKFLVLEKKNIRISRDWVGDRWVDLTGKPDICSFLSSNVASSIQPLLQSAVADGSLSDFSTTTETKLLSIPKTEVLDKDESRLSGFSASDDQENRVVVTLGKPLDVIHEDQDNYSPDASFDVTDKDDTNDSDQASEDKLKVEQILSLQN